MSLEFSIRPGKFIARMRLTLDKFLMRKCEQYYEMPLIWGDYHNNDRVMVIEFCVKVRSDENSIYSHRYDNESCTLLLFVKVGNCALSFLCYENTGHFFFFRSLGGFFLLVGDWFIFSKGFMSLSKHDYQAARVLYSFRIFVVQIIIW